MSVGFRGGEGCGNGTTEVRSCSFFVAWLSFRSKPAPHCAPPSHPPLSVHVMPLQMPTRIRRLPFVRRQRQRAILSASEDILQCRLQQLHRKLSQFATVDTMAAGGVESFRGGGFRSHYLYFACASSCIRFCRVLHQLNCATFAPHDQRSKRFGGGKRG